MIRVWHWRSITALLPVYHIGLDTAPWGLPMVLALAAVYVIRRGGSRAMLVAGCSWAWRR